MTIDKAPVHLVMRFTKKWAGMWEIATPALAQGV